MRKREQRASAKILGIAEVRFGNYVDGETFDKHQTMVEEFVHLIRNVRPHVVITPDPYTRLYRQHPDHRNVGLATLEAVFPAAGIDTYFSEQLEENNISPWWVEETWLIFSDQEHIAVELSKKHVETKVMALQKHWTQKILIKPVKNMLYETQHEQPTESWNGLKLSDIRQVTAKQLNDNLTLNR